MYVICEENEKISQKFWGHHGIVKVNIAKKSILGVGGAEGAKPSITPIHTGVVSKPPIFTTEKTRNFSPSVAPRAYNKSQKLNISTHDDFYTCTNSQ